VRGVSCTGISRSVEDSTELFVAFLDGVAWTVVRNESLIDFFSCKGKDDWGTRGKLDGGTKSRSSASGSSKPCDLANTSVCLLVLGVAEICTL